MDPLLGIVILGAFAFAGLMGCLGNWRSSSRHKSWPSRTRRSASPISRCRQRRSVSGRRSRRRSGV